MLSHRSVARLDSAPETIRSASSQPPSSLWRASARAVRDNLFAEAAGQVIRIGGIAVLARVVTPADFGVFRMLLVVSMLVTLCGQTGIADALIQREEVRSAHEAAGWWITAAFSLATLAALYFAAPMIESVMRMPGLAFGTRLICFP